MGLVASRKRGAAVVEELRSRGVVEDADVARIHTPAGLDIGARTPEEIALSIMAQIVSLRSARSTLPSTAVDPVCGMEVVAAAPTLHAERDGRAVWFCGEGCKPAFEGVSPVVSGSCSQPAGRSASAGRSRRSLTATPRCSATCSAARAPAGSTSWSWPSAAVPMRCGGRST